MCSLLKGLLYCWKWMSSYLPNSHNREYKVAPPDTIWHNLKILSHDIQMHRRDGFYSAHPSFSMTTTKPFCGTHLMYLAWIQIPQTVNIVLLFSNKTTLKWKSEYYAWANTNSEYILDLPNGRILLFIYFFCSETPLYVLVATSCMPFEHTGRSVLMHNGLICTTFCLSVSLGLWDLRCALPQRYMTTLCTTDLHCASPTCIVHMMHKGDLCPWEVEVAPRHFIFFSGSHGTCTKWTLFHISKSTVAKARHPNFIW